MTSPVAISFIIPAHNEETLLAGALQSIHAAAKATGRAYEVIVVDDASTDRTAEVAQAHGAQVVPVSLRRISAVRNAGARASRGAVLIFIDADTQVTGPTVAAALAALDGGAVGGGAAVRMDRPVAIWARPVLWNWNLTSRLMRWAAGCFIFVRRDAFQTVGGFDEQYFVCEELYLSAALKRRGRFVIVRQPVTTSARKVSVYGPWEMLLMMFRVGLGGPRAWRRREGLDMWYKRRDDGSVPPAE